MKRINYIKLLFVLVFPLVHTSCVKDLDLEHLRPDPKLVLNCVALAGDTVKATVSRTWFFTEEKPNVTIRDAEVKLFVNDVFREQMRWVEEGKADYNSRSFYSSSYIPSEGDRIRVEAGASGYKGVKAEAGVPSIGNALVDAWIDNKKDTVGPTVTYVMTYCIKVRDDAAADNYYLLRLDQGYPIRNEETMEYTGEYEWMPASGDFSSDPLFGSDLTIMDKVFGNDWLSGYKGRVFSDELINGKEYTIKIEGSSGSESLYPAPEFPGNNGDEDNFPGTNNPDKDDPETEQPVPPSLLRVQLYALSRPYYLYLKALAFQDDGSFSNMLVEGGLAEPIRVYSNIEGGVGILGACSLDARSIER